MIKSWREPGRFVLRVGFAPLGALIGVVLLLAVGGISWRSSHSSTGNGHSGQAEPSKVGVVPAAVAASSSNGLNAPPTRTSGPVAVAGPNTPTVANTPVSPARIEIPKLHTSAPIVSVATTPNGELDVPLNPRTVGWWSPGARPGAKTGTAILAGHINYAGVTGAMASIGKLTPGDTVRIYGKVNANARREVDFSVTGVRTYHKTTLPYKQIFDQNSIGRIAIVTCGGPFDSATGNYLDNIVVFAVPVAT